MISVAVVSDVHGNADAFDAALSTVNRAGFDRLILLGDLLTYGPDSAAVLDRAESLCARADVSLLEGNHDRLYRDLLRGARGYYDRLPDWLRECVDSVRASVDTERLNALPFLPEVEMDGVLFAHANPYGVPDWRYLNGLAARTAAAATVAERGFRLGVFGHTHRAAFLALGATGSRSTSGRSLSAFRSAPGETGVLDAGSVGQSREGTPDAVVAFLTIEAKRITGAIRRIGYDADGTRRRIESSGMTPDTIARLLGYLPGSE